MFRFPLPLLCVVLLLLAQTMAFSAEALDGLVLEPKWMEYEKESFSKGCELLGVDVKMAGQPSYGIKEALPGVFLGLNVMAARAYCTETRLRALEVVFYETPEGQRGLEEAPFNARKNKVIAALASKLGGKGVGKNYEYSTPKRGLSFSQRALGGWQFWTYKGSDYFLSWGYAQSSSKETVSTVAGQIVLSVTPSIDPQIFQSALWSGNAVDLIGNDKFMNYEWTSEQKDSARSVDAGTLFGIRIPEVVARLDGDRLESLTISLYNRGDNGSYYSSEKGFNELALWICELLDARLGTKGSKRPVSPDNAARSPGMTWRTRDTNLLLEWNGTKTVGYEFDRTGSRVYSSGQFRAEYIRLIISSPRTASAATNKALYGSSRVKSEANGDRYIAGVPMVDQGNKGYCAAAASERLMRYYKKDVDQHDVAKFVNTDGRGGTRSDDFKSGLAMLARRTSSRMTVLFVFDEQYVKKICRAFEKVTERAKRDRNTDLDGADKTLLKQVRIAEKAEYEKFARNVKSYVDQGKPLLWGMVLGILPEDGIPPQIRGGHMRLIIGYNAKQNQIIYTDSWGSGHELKRMPVDDAWAATTGLFLLEP